MADRRRQGSVKGGQGKSARARAQKQLRDSVLDPRDVAGLLSVAMQKVAVGNMHPAIGTALGSMARAYMAIQEVTSLTDRLDELERLAGMENDNVVPMERRRA